MELGHLDKHFIKAQQKSPHREYFCNFFSYILGTLKTTFEWKRWIQSEPFFQNQSNFFFEFQKRAGKVSPHPHPSCALNQHNLEVSKNLLIF